MYDSHSISCSGRITDTDDIIIEHQNYCFTYGYTPNNSKSFVEVCKDMGLDESDSVYIRF